MDRRHLGGMQLWTAAILAALQLCTAAFQAALQLWTAAFQAALQLCTFGWTTVKATNLTGVDHLDDRRRYVVLRSSRPSCAILPAVQIHNEA